MQTQDQAMAQPKAAVGLLVQGKNPRTYFDPVEMEELSKTIKVVGIIQPISVRRIPNGKYEILAGERRWRAAKDLFGDDYEVPISVSDVPDEMAEVIGIIENIQRAAMSPTEEAKAAARLLARMNSDRDDVARTLGWSRSTLDSRLALMNCSDSVRTALDQRKIQLGHAELLAAVTIETQDKVLPRLLSVVPQTTVVELRAQLEQVSCLLAAAIFDTTECSGCQHNSGNQRVLFKEAVAEGRCTSPTCYRQKTDVVIQSRADALKDEYPMVKIVNAGENFTVVKLVAEGPTGVGTEQAKQCRGCANFGAAVSAVPDKMGKVSKELCFDPACNQRKVAEHLKTEKAEQGQAAGLGGGKDNAGPGQEKARKAAKSSGIELSQRVKEYRAKLWRAAYQKEAMNDPDRSQSILIGLVLSGLSRNISDGKMLKAFKALSSHEHDSFSAAPDEAAAAASRESRETREKLLHILSASAADAIDENHLVKLLKWMKVDLSLHWTLNEEFLGILTKSEIEFVATQLGIKKAMGDKFAKAMPGKKDLLIKAVLGVQGFEYTGKVPTSLLYTD